MSRRKRNPERWARYSEQVLRSRIREEEAKQRKIEAGPVDPMRFVPDHSEVFDVAIDHWIAEGGETDPSLGILMGDDWWATPWRLFPREPTMTHTVPVRGSVGALSYQLTHTADQVAITLWRRSWRGPVDTERFGFFMRANGAVVQTWPTQKIPRGVRKYARRVRRDPGRFVRWGLLEPVPMWRRWVDYAVEDPICEPIHPDDWP